MKYTEKYINSKNISHVKVYIECKNWEIEWKKEWKVFNIIIRKSRYVDYLSGGSYTVDEILNAKYNGVSMWYIKDNVVYCHPHLILYMNNGTSHKIYFETKHKIDDFIIRNGFKNVSWIHDGQE